jgi:hypothetical protein
MAGAFGHLASEEVTARPLGPSFEEPFSGPLNAILLQAQTGNDFLQ